MSTQQDINAIRAQRLANTHDPLALMENIHTLFHPDQSSYITYIQHPQPNNFVQQPSFNMNYMPQPMQNPEYSSDPITAMNMALAKMAKAFKFNTIPTINNQRSSLIPRNSQIAQPGVNTSQDMTMKMVDANVGNQNVENMNGISVVPEITNQYGNGNVVTAWDKGNGNGINGNPISCILLKRKKQGSTVLKRNLTSTSGIQSDNAPVYDSDGSFELDRTKEKLENCIIKKEKEYAVLWNNWYTKCKECKYDKISYDKAYNDIQQKIEQLQAQLGDLKGKSSDTQCASNTLDPVYQKLEDENVSLEFQNEINSKINGFSPKDVKSTNMTRRPQPRNNPKNDKVPSKSKSSCLSNKLEKIEENYRNSRTPKNQKHKSSEFNANHDVCVLNYVNDMNSRADNQSANVLKCKNQKKHKLNVKKSKELGSKGSIASSRPSKPRTCLRWIQTGRIFSLCGKLTTSSNTENKSAKSVCDNASTSNPLEPSSKGFPNSTSLLGSSRLDLTYAPSIITTQKPNERELDLLFEAMHDDYLSHQPSAATRTALAAPAPQVLQTPTASTTIADTLTLPNFTRSETNSLSVKS
ncbi:hypothetical protein Tco_0047177 [Tanacetum coccineum]